MSLVSLVKIQNDQTKKAMLDSLELIDYDLPANARNIVIKPNMCYYWDYSTGSTTDPRFVASLIDVLREKISSKIHISIVESDASAMKCEYAFKVLGYEDLSRKYDVSLVNLSEEESDKVATKVGKRTVNLRVPRIVKNADLRINVPKIKYSMPGIEMTCALKNIFGCIPNPRKFLYHPTLKETIVAANKLMPFDLCILDGNVVSGLGTRKLCLVMSSTDPVSFDAVAARIAGVDPRSIRYLGLASKEGLGKTMFTNKGLHLEYFRARYPRRGVGARLNGIAFETIHRLRLERRLMLD